MKFSTSHMHTALCSALILLSAPATNASPSHHRLHHQLDKRHSHLHGRHHHDNTSGPLVKRGTCAFPGDEDSNLVAITPGEKNAGWAMSPDQECTPGSYCPIACKPGMVMAQWDPDSKFMSPTSMNGGLYCNDDGEIEKPFPNEPFCKDGKGTVKAVNKCGSKMSWCQTVLPGNEAMLIPTVVTSSSILAVPDTSYWRQTSAHFYINPPGVGDEGCIWGDDSSAVGNWSPFVCGANVDTQGKTSVMLSWNPEWQKTSLKNTLPEFGVKIECPDGGCNGLPCEIDPTGGSGRVSSASAGQGDAGNNFCVVTVDKGKTAEIIAFTPGGGDNDNREDEDEEEEDDEEEDDEEEEEEEEIKILKEEPTTTSEEPTTSAEPTTSETPTTSEEPSTTSTSTTPTTTSTSTSTSTSTTSSSSSSSVKSSTTPVETSTSFSTPSPTSKRPSPTMGPGIFHENHNDTASETGTGSSTVSDTDVSTAEDASATGSDEEGEAVRRSGSPAVVGLVVAFVAAAYIL